MVLCIAIGIVQIHMFLQQPTDARHVPSPCSAIPRESAPISYHAAAAEHPCSPIIDRAAIAASNVVILSDDDVCEEEAVEADIALAPLLLLLLC